MKRIILAGITSLTGIGGYLVCSAPDCEDPGYLTVNVVQADGEGGFKPAKADTVEYFVSAAPTDEIDRQLTQVLNADCLDGDCTTWRVAPGDSGEITIAAKVCGQSFEEVALVERDSAGCATGDSKVDLVVDLTACPPGGEPPTDNSDTLGNNTTQCTQEMRPSIELHTWRRHHDFFAPTKVGKVTYDYGGPRAKDPNMPESPEVPKNPAATCIDEGCTVWAIGTEMAGNFDLMVESCGQTQEMRVQVPKTADGCHVETQRVDMEITSTGCLAAIPTPKVPTKPPTVDPNRAADAGNDTLTAPPIGDPPLPPEAELEVDGSCTEKAVKRPAFVAHLVKRVEGDMLVSVPAKWVRYSIGAPRRAHVATCTEEPCSDWIGDKRIAGEYQLTASVCGKDSHLGIMVPKAADGCGVETQYLMWEVDTTGCLSNEPVDTHPPSPSDQEMPK